MATKTSTVSAIASARRAAVADRYAASSLAVEWRNLSELESIVDEWRDLATRVLESNIFYEPAFALPAARIFGRDAGALLVWSGTSPRKLLGFFPSRMETRRYGLKLPVLVGWTNPYAPLGTPLVEREAAEPVIAAWLAYLADDPELPGLVLLPFLPTDGPFATALDAIVRRAQMPVADFNLYQRAQLVPDGDRLFYVERTVGQHRHKELRRYVRRLGDIGALLFTTATEPETDCRGHRGFLQARDARLEGQSRHRRSLARRHPQLHFIGSQRLGGGRQSRDQSYFYRWQRHRGHDHAAQRRYRVVLEDRL